MPRRAAREPVLTFKRALLSLIVFFTLLVAGLAAWGGSYYVSPVQERVFHPLHRWLKPSGIVGHGLGIVGTLMMLLIFVYSLRKRSKTLQKIGNQAQWLQAHVFLGLVGPVLVTFHTTGKLGGIVAVAFYSMWAIVISGVFGRYLYAKIPRTLQGNKMTLKEIEEQLAQLVEAVHSSAKKEEVLKGIEQFLARSRQEKGGLFKALWRLMVDDLRFPLNAWRVWSIVGRDRSLSVRQRFRVSRLLLKQRRILEKLAVLDASQRLFSYWHVFHRPFTVMMLVIATLHVSVAVYLGFIPTW